MLEVRNRVKLSWICGEHKKGILINNITASISKLPNIVKRTNFNVAQIQRRPPQTPVIAVLSMGMKIMLWGLATRGKVGVCVPSGDN